MKIFVGVISCGEGDKDRSFSSIEAQERGNIISDVEIFKIDDLSEKKAHDLLHEAFRDASMNNYDVLIKVDADTVLAHQQIFINICEQFVANPKVTKVQAPLHDYFIDDLLNGLNSFSRNVKFRKSCDTLFCDRVDEAHNVRLYQRDLPQSLIPAGFHCHYATECQAFHYGLHRELKGQKDTLALVKKAFQKNRDRIRGMALLGAQAAGSFTKFGGFNYADKQFCDAFEKSSNEYDRLITCLR
jgi:hypothetical protein